MAILDRLYCIVHLNLYSSEIYDLVSCVTEELRSLGADCDVDQTYIGTKVYQYVRDNVPDGTLLPAESSYLDILCAGNNHKASHLSSCAE